MMTDLGIEMIFANSPQAKGHIERYNGTVQKRLPNDIIRFGIHDYDTLNRWFTAFYLPYIRRKFAFLPKDPHDAFVPLDGYDIESIFTLRYERRIKNDSFSINGIYYSLIDENGEIMHILNDIPVNIRVNVFTNLMYVLRYRKKYPVILTRDRRTRPSSIADNQKDLHEILNNFSAKK